MIPTLEFTEILTQITQDILKRMGFEAQVKVQEIKAHEKRTTYQVDVILPEGQSLLIGQHGANIAALLHIVRLAVRKDQPEGVMIALDINHYFDEKKTYLEREAREAAKEVEVTGLPATLRPMMSFERKLIHTLFSEHPTITTESVGRGDDRKILLRRRATDAADEESAA